jgi:hypothetical protein
VCGITINTPSEVKKALGGFVYKKLFFVNEWRCCGLDKPPQTEKPFFRAGGMRA